ncbi:hypothetical protein Pla163_16290 [Planctomycetes bacterium Pla163]|uniref:DUF885 domain-containing protein n=1 Tax=Rohdeia mirabilis TaxID=2528008 RepID=A0A518CZ58_9BACT|nr:hypothetical protein Pla163_16290 [Planctomycetes bacterium Pla163]
MTFRSTPFLVVLLASSCASIAPPPPSDVGLWPDAKGYIESGALGAVTEAHWNGYLASHPEFASSLGDPRFNGDVSDISPIGRKNRRDSLWFIERRVVDISDGSLDEDDRLTRDLLLRTVRTESDMLQRGYDEWDPGRLIDLLVSTATLPYVQPVETQRERDQLLARWNLIPDSIRKSREALERAAGRGSIAPVVALETIVSMCDAMLEADPMDHPLVIPALGGGRWVDLPAEKPLATLATEIYGDASAQLELRRVNRHLQRGEIRALGTRVLIPASNDPLDAEARGLFLEQVLRIVEDEVQPAIARLRATLVDELLPEARGPQRIGLVHLRDGRELYWTLLARELGEGVASPEDYARCVDDVGRLERDVVVLARDVVGVEDLRRLRTTLAADADASPRDGDAVIAAIEARAREARGVLPRAFGSIPATGFRVESLWPAAGGGGAAFTTIAGGERTPTRVFVDTARLGNRSIHEVRALSIVELLPGRHLWTTGAIENPALPRFRRHLATEASGRGFGLYSLAIGSSTGLLTTPGDQLGAALVRLEAAALAAMDFAIHHDGWGRKQALEFLRAHVPVSDDELEESLDRVIARPAVALSTWITARKLESLYDGARSAAGVAFDPAEFHRHLLAAGPVPAGYLVRALAR